MRAFVAAVITDAIKKTHVRNCGCKEVTVRFHFLNQKIITRDKFVSDIFDNPDVVMDQFSGKSQTVPPQTHWFGVKDSNVAWTAHRCGHAASGDHKHNESARCQIRTYCVPRAIAP